MLTADLEQELAQLMLIVAIGPEDPDTARTIDNASLARLIALAAAPVVRRRRRAVAVSKLRRNKSKNIAMNDGQLGLGAHLARWHQARTAYESLKHTYIGTPANTWPVDTFKAASAEVQASVESLYKAYVMLQKTASDCPADIPT